MRFAWIELMPAQKYCRMILSRFRKTLILLSIQEKCLECTELMRLLKFPYRLLFKGSKTGAYLTVERHRGSTVPLGVWEVDETDEKNLDRYEGYPAFYYKKSVKLNVRSLYGDREQILDAFLYIMHEERHLGLPSAQYVSVCRQGYTDFGFNEKFLRRALADSMGDKK